MGAVPAPSYLLIRAPFFVDQPIPHGEFKSIETEPYFYVPAAMEPGQSFRYTVSMIQRCVVVRPVDVSAAGR